METGNLFWIFLLSTGLVILMHAPGINTGINLADEGYLWQGTLKVLEGSVPIRDFRAYDPGRYYWCAIWMSFLGRDLVSLRIVMIVTQIMALTMGVSAVFISTGLWEPTLLATLALAAWMLPRYKQIDILFPMAAAFISALLVITPIPTYYVLSGAFVGICLLFGLNHAIYAGGGLSLLIGIMTLRSHGLELGESLIWYTLGLGIGALPAFAVIIGVPGLLQNYWRQKILKILKRKTTNLPLPVPWFWRPMPLHLKHLNRWTGQVVRAGFTIMPIFYGITLLQAMLKLTPLSPQEWAGVAVSCVGVFYMHHAMSRADITHLAQASPPLIIGLVIYLSRYAYGWAMLAGFIVISLWFIYRPQELFARTLRKPEELNTIEIGGNSLQLPREMVHYLSELRDMVKTYSKHGDPVLLLPNLVTLYPLFARRPAVYDIFCVYPATDEEQTAMINQVIKEGPRFALISNRAIDSRNELRFSNTHPKVWAYLHREFTVLDISGRLPDDHHVFIKPHLI